jgi:hypothetical protein
VSCVEAPAFYLVPSGGAVGNTAPMALTCAGPGGAPAEEGSWARRFCLIRAGRVPAGTLQIPAHQPGHLEALSGVPLLREC